MKQKIPLKNLKGNVKEVFDDLLKGSIAKSLVHSSEETPMTEVPAALVTERPDLEGCLLRHGICHKLYMDKF